MEETKRLKILVGVNTLSVLDQAVYANHCQFWFRLGRSYADVDFAFYTPRRASIDRMRNEAGKFAIQHEFDYLLFIDDDVMIPFDGLAKLMKTDADIAAGWTIIRGYPFDNMFFKYLDETNQTMKRWNDWTEKDLVDGLLPCDAVGFSFCLIKVDLLRKVPPPFFVTGPFNTEDIYFCIKARIQDPTVRIVVDPTVETQHLFGSEFIAPSNKVAYTKYLKEAYPGLCEDEDKGVTARGDDYLAQVDPLDDPLEPSRNELE